MHHIYHTNSIVLDTFPTGEADMTILLFTKELGMILAVAKSVRSAKSKLRYSLQIGSVSKVDLVKGKQVWRVISATPIDRINILDAETRAVVAKAVRFVKRMVDKEKEERGIYSDLESLLFSTKKGHSKEKLAEIELVFYLRSLFGLGYIANNTEFRDILSREYSISELETLPLPRKKILDAIKNAIYESHL
ncbi:MAG: DNA repair protein RecO [Candidatus Pacebacteria bacterium]|jgi:DNA repair protein RecO|nr:DNA repair protein RecO [Candidatus Paceibacterota bacterium]MBP9058287.1 DNA repair protein RecO [Candidatus Paceibacterota bacterium]MBP9770477.1 DNA repair protein RecO [Candidatus Paceibacterota bacterium]